MAGGGGRSGTEGKRGSEEERDVRKRARKEGTGNGAMEEGWGVEDGEGGRSKEERGARRRKEGRWRREENEGGGRRARVGSTEGMNKRRRWAAKKSNPRK